MATDTTAAARARAREKALEAIELLCSLVANESSASRYAGMRITAAVRLLEVAGVGAGDDRALERLLRSAKKVFGARDYGRLLHQIAEDDGLVDGGEQNLGNGDTASAKSVVVSGSTEPKLEGVEGHLDS